MPLDATAARTLLVGHMAAGAWGECREGAQAIISCGCQILDYRCHREYRHAGTPAGSGDAPLRGRVAGQAPHFDGTEGMRISGDPPASVRRSRASRLQSVPQPFLWLCRRRYRHPTRPLPHFAAPSTAQDSCGSAGAAARPMCKRNSPVPSKPPILVPCRFATT
jgi:rhodanese-related sulfurtransferase